MRRVVTVTLNPAIDHTITLGQLSPGQVHRAIGEQYEAGGKGIRVAATLAALGVPAVASGWLGDGNPARFEDAFARLGITDAMLRLAGSTRSNLKLVDRSRGETTDINLPGIALEPDALAAAEDALAVRLAAWLAPGDWCVLAGSLPPGAGVGSWERLARQVHALGARLVVDTGGAVLGALLARLGRPDAAALPCFIKPNRAELEELSGRPLPTLAAVAEAAAALQSSGIAQVVVSLGAEGAVIVGDGGRWFARPPAVTAATTVGAGDALVAGTLAALVGGSCFPDAAVFGMACAAARIQRIAHGMPPRPEIDALAAQVRLAPI